MPTIQGTDGDVTGFLPDEVAVRSYRTPVVDLLAAGAAYPFDAPHVRGKLFGSCSFSVHANIVARTGTAVGNVALALAQNGVSIQGATVNLLATALNAALTLPIRATSSPITVNDIDLSTPLQVLIVTPTTGATVMSAWFEIFGNYK